jgi:hypothetical protein
MDSEKSYIEQALDRAPEIAKLVGVSNSEARMKIAGADEDKCRELVEALDTQQRFSRLLGFGGDE